MNFCAGPPCRFWHRRVVQSRLASPAGKTDWAGRAGDQAAAAVALRAAVELDASDARAHLWLSQVLRATGDVNGSVEHAARARQLDPDVG